MEITQSQWDVIIVGAGPSGLFAAYELVEKQQGLKILIIDKGAPAASRKCRVSDFNEPCANCQPCNIMCGVGAPVFFLMVF